MKESGALFFGSFCERIYRVDNYLLMVYGNEMEGGIRLLGIGA